MTPCSIHNCPHPGRLTVHVRRPGWTVPESRPVCRKHHAEVERARMADGAACAVPGCPHQKLARHLCADHIDAAHRAGALGLLGWWPTSERVPREGEVQRLVDLIAKTHGRAA